MQSSRLYVNLPERSNSYDYGRGQSQINKMEVRISSCPETTPLWRDPETVFWRSFRESFLWEQLPSVTSLLCDNSEIQWRGDVNQNIQRSNRQTHFGHWFRLNMNIAISCCSVSSSHPLVSSVVCIGVFSSQRHSSCELCVGKYFFALALQSHSCLSSCHWKRDKPTMTHFWNIT